jgi:hypothetical protein
MWQQFKLNILLHLCVFLTILEIRTILFFFCGGRGLNHRPCIYYALSKPIELRSRGQFKLFYNNLRSTRIHLIFKNSSVSSDTSVFFVLQHVILSSNLRSHQIDMFDLMESRILLHSHWHHKECVLWFGARTNLESPRFRLAIKYLFI